MLGDSPASYLSELVDNDSLRLHLDPNDMLWGEVQILKTLKGEQERPVALFCQRSCGGVYLEGEEWITEALLSWCHWLHLPPELDLRRFVVTYYSR